MMQSVVGYDAVLRSLANDNRELSVIFMMKSALMCKVCQQRSPTKCEYGDNVCGPSMTEKGCYLAHILGIAKGTDYRQQSVTKKSMPITPAAKRWSGKSY